MKLRKIMAGVVASALAASTLAVAASAQCLTKIEGTEAALSTAHGSFSSITRVMKLRASPQLSSTSTTQRSLLLHLLSR